MLSEQFSLGSFYNIEWEWLVPDVSKCQVMLRKLKIQRAYKGKGGEGKNLELALKGGY